MEKKRGWPYKVSEYFITDKDYYNFDVLYLCMTSFIIMS